MGSGAGANELSYDLFLSYNSVDHRIVEEVAHKLADAGFKEVFLDRWNLLKGTRWRPMLEKALSSSKAVAIFVGLGEMGSWQQREVDIALDLQSKSPSLPVIPVLLPGCEPPLGFLRQLTWVDLRTQTLDRGIAILIKAATGKAPGPDLQKHYDSVRASICPYRGLLHFREEDAPFFFGREAAIEGLVEGVKHHPFLALVGASGSGKSSVVRAGLVPRLRSDHRTTWEFISLVPTDQPLKALAAALVPFLEPTKSEVDRLEEAGKLAGLFAGGTVSLYDVVRRILDKQLGTNRVLILVDQFEELYTLVQEDAIRRKFVDELITASSLSGSKLIVTITLRGDFVGKAFAYRALSDRLQGAQINLGPMTRQELTLVIRKPAEKLQLSFEAGLVERILDSVGDEPGNLPLLEFVLTELWEQRRGGLLLNESYDTMGELKGALAKKADDFFEKLSAADQKVLQRVFLRIVRPSESGEDTRRRAAITELPSEGVELVVKLANERLLVTNKSVSGTEQTVEVAHEALISNWSTLRNWINEDREFLLWRDRLGTLLTEWERAQESDEALLRGPLLTEAQKWFDQRSQDLSDEERKFITASRAVAEKRRQQQAAAAKSLRRLAWVLAAVALVAVGGAIFGFWQKSEAEVAKAETEKERQQAVVAKNDAERGRHDAEAAKAEAKRQEAKAKENANKERASRNAAEEQARIAETQRLSAQTSEKRANDARDQADGLINFMLYDLRDRLKAIGRLDVLNDVAKKAKGYLDRLPKELVTPSRLEQQAAMLSNLGDVLVSQGKLQEALEAYQQSLKIGQTLAEQDKTNSGWQRDLSVSYNEVGDVLMAQGKTQDALDVYEQSLAIAKRLAEQDKSNSGWQRDLSISYDNVGNVLVAKGKLQDALDAYQQGLAIRTLAEQDKSNSNWQRDLSVSYDKVGYILEAQGKLQNALDVYQQGLEITKRLAEQDKSNSNWQRDLSGTYDRVGGVLEAQGKLQDALDAYQQSSNIRRTLTEQDKSNTDWQRELTLSYDNVGGVLKAQGKLQDALDAYQQSSNIRRTLADQDKSNAGWLLDLSVSYDNVGGVLEAQGKLQDALDVYQQGLEINKRLAERDRSNPHWQRDLSVSYDRVGGVLEAQDKLQDALDAYQKSSNIRRTLAEQDKSNSGWQRDLSVSYGKVGDVLLAEGELQEALDAYQQGLEIDKRLAEQDKSNSNWQRDLSVSYEKVGGVLEAQGKLQEALDAYQQSSNIHRTLADQDKSNAGWLRDLSVSYDNVGHVLEAQGKLQEALDFYEQSLAIAKRLADLDKSDARWQRDLSWVYEKVGDVLVAKGKLQEALDAYQQDLAIAKRLAEQDKSNSGWQRDLSLSYEKVGDVLVAQGKLQEALDVYQQSLKIHQTLAEQDKSNSGWQRDLSVSYEKVGDVLVAQGKLQEALDAYQQDLAIAKALAEQDPTNAVWQNATAWSRYCVAKVLIRIKDGDRNEARRLVIEGIDIIKRLEHQGALDTNAQDTLNKLNEIATALTSSSSK
jgi:tetratricopeptide (TPR) repeat protein